MTDLSKLVRDLEHPTVLELKLAEENERLRQERDTFYNKQMVLVAAIEAKGGWRERLVKAEAALATARKDALLERAVKADAAARKKGKSAKWKPAAPSPYDLSETRKGK